MNPIKNDKAISLIIEQVFIILFGIMIFVTVITVFSDVRSDTYDFVSEEQMGVVGNYVHSSVVTAKQAMEFSDYGKMLIEIPSETAGTPYYVYLNNSSIKVVETKGYLNYTVNISNSGSNLFGNISSTSGGKHYVVYNKSDNSIKLKTEY